MNWLLELQEKTKIQDKGLWGSDRKVMEEMIVNAVENCSNNVGTKKELIKNV
ncbi:MAG: hypothetical protein PHE67_00300 [Campylobacterales bacterium]|nr:hypothetical protein [Campylobacterales bacterium]